MAESLDTPTRIMGRARLIHLYKVASFVSRIRIQKSAKLILIQYQPPHPGHLRFPWHPSIFPGFSFKQILAARFVFGLSFNPFFTNDLGFSFAFVSSWFWPEL